MGRIISFSNRKGGSGKTTTSVNVSAGLALLGKKVCLIDTDPQAHSTLSLGFRKFTGGGLYAVLVDNKDPLDVLLDTDIDNLKLIPASRNLLEYEREFSSHKELRTILTERISGLITKFDYILFDTSPTVSLLTLSSLIASKEVIIPMQTHFLAMEGLAEMVKLIYQINKFYNPDLKLKGIVPTFFSENTRLSRTIINQIRENLGQKIILSPIRVNIALAEAPSFGKSIFEYSKSCHGYVDYYNLSKQIEKMGRE